MSLKPTTRGTSIEIGWPSMAASASMPADAPAEHAQTVDRRRMRVGAHTGIEIGQRGALRELLAHDHLRQIFDVDLVDDAGSRRHHAEVLEGLLPPAQEPVAFPVALVFDVHVDLDGVLYAVGVDLHRMVDDHVGLHLGVDHLGIAAKRLDGIAHRGQVDHAGTPVKSCITTREGMNWISWLVGRRIPCEQFPNLLIGDVGAVDVAHQVLDQHLQRVRPGDPTPSRSAMPVVVIRLVAHLEDIQLFVAQRHSSSEISWMLRATNTTGRLCQPFFSRLYCEMRH